MSDFTTNENAKSKKPLIIGIVAVVLVIAVIIAFIFGRSNGYLSIKIIELFGTVTYDRGNDKDVAVYDSFKPTGGDRMKTDKESYVRLSLDSDKYVFVEEKSDLAFESTKKGRILLHLEEGAIVNEIEKKLGDDESYEVKTPNALMAVRGTRFRVSTYVGADGILYTRISGVEGRVECQLIYEDGGLSEKTVLTEAGSEAIIYQDKIVNITDFVKFDEEGTPNLDRGSELRKIVYSDFPRQTLEYLINRAEENSEISIPVDEIKEILADLPFVSEPELSLGNTPEDPDDPTDPNGGEIADLEDNENTEDNAGNPQNTPTNPDDRDRPNTETALVPNRPDDATPPNPNVPDTGADPKPGEPVDGEKPSEDKDTENMEDAEDTEDTESKDNTEDTTNTPETSAPAPYYPSYTPAPTPTPTPETIPTETTISSADLDPDTDNVALVIRDAFTTNQIVKFDTGTDGMLESGFNVPSGKKLVLLATPNSESDSINRINANLTGQSSIVVSDNSSLTILDGKGTLNIGEGNATIGNDATVDGNIIVYETGSLNVNGGTINGTITPGHNNVTISGNSTVKTLDASDANSPVNINSTNGTPTINNVIVSDGDDVSFVYLNNFGNSDDFSVKINNLKYSDGVVLNENGIPVAFKGNDDIEYEVINYDPDSNTFILKLDNSND